MLSNLFPREMEQLVQMALRARTSVEITNTCAVFVESEIISHLAAGKSKASKPASCQGCTSPWPIEFLLLSAALVSRNL